MSSFPSTAGYAPAAANLHTANRFEDNISAQQPDGDQAVAADAHMHLFVHGYHRRLNAPVDEDVNQYEEIRNQHNIAVALAIGYEAEGIDPNNNAYLQALAATRPWMTTLAFLPIWPPPTPEHLKALFAAGHRGIAVHCLDAISAQTVADWPASLWGVLEHQGALVSFNATPEAHPRLAELVNRTPGCEFLFSHVGQPGQYRTRPSESSAAQRLSSLLGLRAADNCWVKISALYSISAGDHLYPYPEADPFVSVVLDAFGPSKCLWGSDFSPTLDHGSFEQAIIVPQLSHLSTTERDQVMGSNLMGLLTHGDPLNPTS